MTSDEERLLASIDEQETVRLLQELVRAPSGNPPGNEEAAARVLGSYLWSAGLDPEFREVQPGRPNLVARMGAAGGPTLLLNGHLDTMPHGVGWTVDPHGGEIRDGYLYGLGSADQKAGVAAMAAAAVAVQRAGVPLRGALVLSGVIDEEGAGLGATALVRGGLRADWAIITEPTELAIVNQSNGQINFELTFRGTAGHGSTPEVGHNAIYDAACTIAELEHEARRLRERSHPVVGPSTLNVGTIQGGTVTSIIPAECRVTVDRRVIPGDSVEQAVGEMDALLERLRGERPAMRVERRTMMAIPPVDVAEDLPVSVALRGAAEEVLGAAPGFGGLRGTTDAATFDSAGIPTLIFGPGSLSGAAHQADERVSLGELRAATRILALTIVRLLT
jgi:acetylornithine deacetylase